MLLALFNLENKALFSLLIHIDMKIRQKGFTLIELLVVIAVIGILSVVVLASLGTARNKAKDAVIQSQMKSLQVQAELYYAANSNSYGTAGSTCSTAGSLFVDTDVARLITRIEADNGSASMACNNTTTAWAVSTALPSSPSNTFMCVDSTGASNVTSSAPTITDQECD